MDLCGNLGVFDANPADANYGYYTNGNPAANINPVATVLNNTALGNAQLNALFNGNDTTINQIAFGDGVLDVCDVYVTYRRSLDPSLTWFRRFWNDGHRVAETVPNVAPQAMKSPSSIPRWAETARRHKLISRREIL